MLTGYLLQHPRMHGWLLFVAGSVVANTTGQTH